MPCYKISATEKNRQPWRAYAEAREERPIRDWLAEAGLAVESLTPVGIWNRYHVRLISPKVAAIGVIASVFFVPRWIFGRGLVTYARDLLVSGEGSFLGLVGCTAVTIFPLLVLIMALRIVYSGLVGEQAIDTTRRVRYHNIQRRAQAPVPK